MKRLQKISQDNPIRERLDSCPPFTQGSMPLALTENVPLLLLMCLTLYQIWGIHLLF